MFLNYNSSGQALVTLSAVSASSVFKNGLAYDSTGALHVTTGTPAATDPCVGGIALTTSGQVYMTSTAPSPAIGCNGLLVNSSGAIYASNAGTIAVYQGGMPFTSDGGLVVTGLNPIPGLSPAAYYKFNTGLTDAGGGACSAWADQSGNGRNLLQGTGASRPTIQGDGSLLFDGVDDFLKANAFTLNQPETIYLRFKQVTWTNSDYVFDGNAFNVGAFYQKPSSPTLRMIAGAAEVADNTNLAVNTYGSVAVVFNGASSSILVNATTETTGNPGASNMGGFILGAAGTAAGAFSNIQVKEVAIFASAHDATTRASVIAYLSTL